ncbi:MAG: Gfo/Idh/MocA family oxidoreductase [Caldilineaceae bacterium]
MPTTAQHPPVRMAIAGMSHGHVNWILRSLQRDNLEIVGFWEPNRALAERYAGQYNFSLDLVYADLDAMLDAVKPEAVCAFGSIYEHLQVVEACAPRKIHVMVEKPLAVNMEHAEHRQFPAHSNSTTYESVSAKGMGNAVSLCNSVPAISRICSEWSQ